MSYPPELTQFGFDEYIIQMEKNDPNSRPDDYPGVKCPSCDKDYYLEEEEECEWCGYEPDDKEPTEAQLMAYYYGGTSAAERTEMAYRAKREVGG